MASWRQNMSSTGMSTEPLCIRTLGIHGGGKRDPRLAAGIKSVEYGSKFILQTRGMILTNSRCSAPYRKGATYAWHQNLDLDFSALDCPPELHYSMKWCVILLLRSFTYSYLHENSPKAECPDRARKWGLVIYWKLQTFIG